VLETSRRDVERKGRALVNQIRIAVFVAVLASLALD